MVGELMRSTPTSLLSGLTSNAPISGGVFLVIPFKSVLIPAIAVPLLQGLSGRKSNLLVKAGSAIIELVL